MKIFIYKMGCANSKKMKEDHSKIVNYSRDKKREKEKREKEKREKKVEKSTLTNFHPVS